MFEISEAELKNLSRGLNMIGSTKSVFNVSRFKPALNWNRFLADLRRGSNSLNSDSVSLKWMEKLTKSVRFASFYIVLHRFASFYIVLHRFTPFLDIFLLIFCIYLPVKVKIWKNVWKSNV